MSKLVKQIVKVKCSHTGTPLQVQIVDQSTCVARVLDHWSDTGCWWEGESEKHFYRLLLDNDATVEIYQDLLSQDWFLYKVYD